MYESATIHLFQTFSIKEQGAIIEDFSNEVDNETLAFDDNRCDEVLTLNGSTLLLKKSLLDPSICVIYFFSPFFFICFLFISHTYKIILTKFQYLTCNVNWKKNCILKKSCFTNQKIHLFKKYLRIF